jgi:hypothetical protein
MPRFAGQPIASAAGPRFAGERVSAEQVAAPQGDLGDVIGAGFSSAVNAIPIVGPSVLGGLEELKARVHGVPVETIRAEEVGIREQNPVASTVGTVTGAVAPYLIGGAIPIAARGLGMVGSLGARTLASATSGAAISGADTLARGGDWQDAGQSALLGGGIGALAPGVGDFIGNLLGIGGRKIAGAVDGMINPDRAAERVVRGTVAQDLRSTPAMSQAEEAAAALNQQPVINADRFGQGTRSLARTAANSDPSADAALRETTEQRFLTQAPRAVDFVRRITGGATDDIALQEGIANAARTSNHAAYSKAYAAPGAQMVWTPEIRQLFQSPEFIDAIRSATRTGANDAAISGNQAVQNPFTFDAKGNIALRKQADGSTAVPNLEFWDIVQRGLRASSEKAAKGGDKLLSSQIKQMRNQLLGGLDSAVPEFAGARKGAAAAFGAEDAIEAGRNFVTQRKAIPEARRAWAQFTPAERKAFGTGFASELIDKINAAGDRVNVINQVFGSPASRQQVELALGKSAAQELEQFVRIEDIMQMTKHAVQGNSSTAKQLIAAGLVGGGLGGAMGGWQPGNIATGAFLFTIGRAGARAIGKQVDQRVMRRVADMLTSEDISKIAKTIPSGSRSGAYSDAVRAIQTGLSSAIRAGGMASARPGPVEITVQGGSAPTGAPALR